MRGVLFRFIGLDVMNFHETIWWVLAAIWAALLIAALLSLRVQTVSLPIKLVWMALIIALPLLGLAIYTVWCLARADWTFLKPLLNSRSDAVRSVTGKAPR